MGIVGDDGLHFAAIEVNLVLDSDFQCVVDDFDHHLRHDFLANRDRDNLNGIAHGDIKRILHFKLSVVARNAEILRNRLACKLLATDERKQNQSGKNNQILFHFD